MNIGAMNDRDCFPKIAPAQLDENPTEILVPMDFSACALNALQTAVRFARKYGARITLLHVVEVNLCATYRVDTTRVEREIVAEAEKNLAQIIQSLSASVRFATKIVKGRPFEQILRTAREHGIKLIIMGKRRATFWNFLHRQTARRVMEKAACDVIVVAEANAIYPRQMFSTSKLHKRPENIGDVKCIMSNYLCASI